MRSLVVFHEFEQLCRSLPCAKLTSPRDGISPQRIVSSITECPVSALAHPVRGFGRGPGPLALYQPRNGLSPRICPCAKPSGPENLLAIRGRPRLADAGRPGETMWLAEVARGSPSCARPTLSTSIRAGQPFAFLFDRGAVLKPDRVHSCKRRGNEVSCSACLSSGFLAGRYNEASIVDAAKISLRLAPPPATPCASRVFSSSVRHLPSIGPFVPPLSRPRFPASQLGLEAIGQAKLLACRHAAGQFLTGPASLRREIDGPLLSRLLSPDCCR